ncbi:MAG TPA: hypothetical protein VG817_09845 [Gemmatimonadales bacterium]|nr:hypothetical protein [Gemmatimonadales bacterium]
MLRTALFRRGMAMAASLVVAAAAGCATRDRLFFSGPDEPGGEGPSSIIDVPLGDTTVPAGPTFSVTGLVTAPSGIDTIYFDTEGGLSSFLPEVHAGTSFRFGLPLTTTGLAGDTITVRVYATDNEGHRGDTATRRIAIE